MVRWRIASIHGCGSSSPTPAGFAYSLAAIQGYAELTRQDQLGPTAPPPVRAGTSNPRRGGWRCWSVKLLLSRQRDV